MLDKSEREPEMEKKYPKTKNRESRRPIRRKPLPKDPEESTDSLYHIAIAIIFGIILCLVMGALDHFSLDTTPTTHRTGSIEYFD